MLNKKEVNKKMLDRIELGIKLLNGWDYQYDVDKPQGGIMEAWEFMIATYMHETKISDVRLRRGILSIPVSEGFLYNQIGKWAQEDMASHMLEYC